MTTHRKKKVLIVNAYLDETRRLTGRPHFIPQAMGPVYLAGAFNPSLVEVRVYSEFHSGPLLDRDLLAWPDMLVLTGMTSCYDRMLHLSAYVRTFNPEVVVVAGGSAIRALSRHSAQFFHYCCLGDVEELQEVARDAFGASYASQEVFPRYDLMSWMGHVGYVESSRNCNFACGFCTLTGEGGSYQTYDLDHLRRQILAVGWRRNILFLDNNFYGNDRAYFRAKLELVRDLYKDGRFSSWSALVTSDFFLDAESLRLAKESGCAALFSGVESFDAEVLRGFRKKQNLRLPQVEMIESCLRHGIVFLYGLIFDINSRSLEKVHSELDLITSTPRITLPSFINLAVPILGTPFFHDMVERDQFLPHTKLRDMDGNTLVLKSRDPIPALVKFLDDMPTMRGYKLRVARHSMNFFRYYRRNLGPAQMIAALGNAALLCLPSVAHNHGGLLHRRSDIDRRTYVTTSEDPGLLYRPAWPVDPAYASWFRPTMITNGEGQLVEELRDDLAPARRRSAHLPVVGSDSE